MDQTLVEEFIDREAIRQLPVLYCHYVRLKRFDDLVDLFTEQATFTFQPSGMLISGRDALRRMFQETLSEVDPWPLGHNHVIDLAGDVASGVVTAEVRSGVQNMRTIAIGCYEDTYRKQRLGQWKFESRDLTSTSVLG